MNVQWSDSINEIALAHSLFLKDVENPKKDNEVKHGGKTQFSHAKLEDVLEMVRPLLSAHGLSLMHFPSFDAEAKTVTISQLLSHESGQWISSKCCLPYVASNFMNAMQSVGSTITYGRRYLLMAICGIAAKGEDDESTFVSPPQKQVVSQKQDAPIQFVKPASGNKTSLRELSELVKKHEIPETIKNLWKSQHNVEDLRFLTEEQAKVIVVEVKKAYD